MSDTNDISRAVALLKQTLPEMNKRNIATTPENYAVWYEYVNGKNTDLVNEINLLDLNKSSFGPEIHKDLHSRHIASAHESAVNQLSEGVKDVINDFLSKVSVEGNGLSQYAQVLTQFSSNVANVQDINDIKSLISHLVDETHKREEATQSMQVTLESMATEMKKLRSEVARLNAESTTDSLTKVSNRRAFDIDIEAYMSAAEGSPLCLLILDVDYFQKFNDKYGEVIGDKVLRFVATLFRKNLKGSDFIARFHEDEFAILLPETSYNDALTVAENIRDRLAKQTLSDSAAKMQLGTITVSIGVSCYLNGEYVEELVGRASACMHEAKHQGRNQVIGEQAFKSSAKNSILL